MARRKAPPPLVLHHDSQGHPTKAEMAEPGLHKGGNLLMVSKTLMRPVICMRHPRKKK